MLTRMAGQKGPDAEGRAQAFVQRLMPPLSSRSMQATDEATRQPKKPPPKQGNPLRSPFATTAICPATLLLSACSKTPPSPTPPPAYPAPLESAAAPAGSQDPSVPPTASEITPALPTKPDPTAGRTNRTMTKAQESNAMPLPGQNNDHSAPLTPPKRASGP